MPDTTLHTAAVDLDGLMRVLGESLYSTPYVALRELVQNAHDSCTRRRIEQGDFEAQITVRPLASEGRLVIADNGAGLTHDEVLRYLATVGAGYTRILREESGETGLIGAFGLGFLSAYVVADRVEVLTRSADTPEEGWRFITRDGQRFTLEPCDALPWEGPGTEVHLTLRSRFRELAEPEFVRPLLRRYACLLPLPVCCPSPVNAEKPPWRLEREGVPDLRKRKQDLDFVSGFDPRFEPACTFPIQSALGQGLMWIQDGASYGSTDNRRVVLFVRGMLITDDARELLPHWAGFVGVVMESDALSPTASREDVQKDEAYEQLAQDLKETLIQGLQDLPRQDPEAWRLVLRRHNEALLGAALCDARLLQTLGSVLRLPSSEGDLTVPELARRSHGQILVNTNEADSFDDILYRALGQPVVDGRRYAALPFAQAMSERQALKLVQLGTKGGDRSLFHPAQIDPDTQATLETLFGEPDLKVQAARFQPHALPLVRVPDQAVLLKRRLESEDADRRISRGLLRLARNYTDTVSGEASVTLYVNLDAPLVAAALRAQPPQRGALAQVLKAYARLLGRGESAQLTLALEAMSTGLLSLLPTEPLE